MNLGEGVRLVSFGILALIVLGGALGVVLAPSMVHAAFLLGLVFVGMSGLYLLLNADFVAAAQILIYVGAVNVLLLFAIMLVNRRIPDAAAGKRGLRNTIAGFVCLFVFGSLVNGVVRVPWPISTETPIANSTLRIGEQFFSYYLLPFEAVSILLLLALVGAIILARREFVPDRTESGDQPLVLPERPRAEMDETPKLPETTGRR
ncbi:NADH-quinone oxidoreductase subunit J [Candidatus Cyanaurora vandensis]|uniref:NADH-quinone oxidoreductase subunit J n=1 Tax=Candidatus Cyanaurora vandensis TaxID=2714958 RepID=UPI00257E4DE5|nr:NADH-quinone oxidoreductase subunit J [Candidatus Cyanaurora vandensis]